MASPAPDLQERFELRCLGPRGEGADTSEERRIWATGRACFPQQSFRPWLGHLSPNGRVLGGQPAWGFSNGPQFLEGAGRRDKTAVTRGP